MNRSAEDKEWSSLHYGGEGIWFPLVKPRCVRTTRCGRILCDPGRAQRLLAWQQDKQPYKPKAK